MQTSATVPAGRHAEAVAEPRVTTKRRPHYLNTRTFTSHIFYGPYIYLPIICAFAWLAALLSLIGMWVKAGKPKYAVTEPHVVFISDVAGSHKPVFIPLCCVTCVFYVLSLLAERWLRHSGRLPGDLRRRESVFSWIAIVFAAIGGTALILLSVFDTFSHKTVHWSMTAIFIVGVAISACFQSGEIWSLYKDHPNRMSLLGSSIAKLVVVMLAVLGAITFGALYGTCRGTIKAHGSFTSAKCDMITSGCAALEWTIGFLLFFYFLTLAWDLWGAAKTSPRYIRRLAEWEEKHGVAPTTHLHGTTVSEGTHAVV